MATKISVVRSIIAEYPEDSMLILWSDSERPWWYRVRGEVEGGLISGKDARDENDLFPTASVQLKQSVQLALHCTC